MTDPRTDRQARIPWGDGQTILREILLVADHNAYHIGEFGIMRRVMGTWGPTHSSRAPTAACVLTPWSQSQKALRVAVRDPIFVGGTYRELIQEGARLPHRLIRVVGGEHDPVDTHLKQQVEERWGVVEAAECVVEVLAEVGADRAFQFSDTPRGLKPHGFSG